MIAVIDFMISYCKFLNLIQICLDFDKLHNATYVKINEITLCDRLKSKWPKLAYAIIQLGKQELAREISKPKPKFNARNKKKIKIK